MRRNSALAVDTSAAKRELAYDLDASPRSSLYSETKSIKSTIKSSNVPSTPITPSAGNSTPTAPPKHAPSIRLLFSLLTPHEVLFLLLPAILLSMVAGGIAPFMTYVIGQSFSAFARFPQTSPAPESAKKALLHDVGIAALELVGLAVGSFALSSMTSWLWIWIGERNVLRLRKRVYSGIVGMEMEWFDLKLGGGEPGNVNNSLESPTADQGDGPIGAGGLMAKFAKETDDVRTATSLASGMLIQYLTTCLTCLILAFTRSWSLTLVILSAVPALTLIQGFSQRFAGPLLGRERTQTASAATLIERSIASIATVKAFNAQSYETKRLSVLLTSLTSTATKLNAVWGLTSCMAQFVMMAMFVQGFWFGSKLVRDGKIDAGDVMSVFWACLIATSNLQMCIPQFITLAKGKFSMVSLLNLVDEPPQRPSQSPAGFATSPHTLPLPTTPVTPSTHSLYSTKRKLSVHAPIALRKIRPSRCTGELSLHNVTFAYPSRPTVLALQNVSIYLPANETTFIVGQSGSGKSTIGQLLLGMYKLGGEGCGVITIDDRDVRYLDDQWIRSAVGSVGQSAGVVVVDGLSLWGNLVLGFHPADSPTRQQVDEACRLALLNEFVRDLPDGYDTALGSGDSSSGGAGLSGGQKQRLAIARARLRDPPILILDEATSALDPTTRVLVFEAIKRWRKNKTTIVITHDLSQITKDDFVYVLKGGKVVEQGYRCDLEQAASSSDSDGGEFRRMMDMQNLTGGFLPEKELVNEKERVSLLLEESEEDHHLGADDEKRTAEQDGDAENSAMMLRPITIGNWMFDVVADLTRASVIVAGTGNQQAGKRNTVSDKTFPSAVVASREPARTSRFFPSSPQVDLEMGIRPRRPLSVHIAPGTTYPSAPSPPLPAYTVSTRRFSLQFTPTSPTFNINDLYVRDDTITNEDDRWEREFEKEKKVVEKSGVNAVGVRGSRATRRRWDDGKALPLVDVHVDPRTASSSSVDEHTNDYDAPPRFWATVRRVYPTIPNKPILFLGLLTCLLSGSMTPIFSFLLSRLLFETSTGAHNAPTINRYGGIVLGVAALDGFLMGLKFWLMESVGAWWVKKVRLAAFSKVLGMDKKWFDKVGSAEEYNEEEGQERNKDSKTTATSENNSPARLVQTLIKDSDDAHSLISVVFGQCLVVLAMLSVGLIWALARGWQLTFVGFAIAPVFIIVMALQTRFVGSCELRNKRARESIARSFYETISNIRSIRSMSYEPVFQKRFDDAAENALNIGLRGAFVEGCTYGVASGLIYLAEALLFYVGAVLIAKGIYDYLRMVEVLNLVVFTVTIGSQLMAFTQKIAKSVQATHDLQKLLNLPTETDESKGGHKPYALKGPITFSNVNFAYPERPDVPVLKNLSFSISPGEHVAIVGPSGSGKSTVALLLQRLYEPQSGRITIGMHSLDAIEVRHLRDHVAVVSQQPNLFDASVSDNIRYGREWMGEVEVINAAIKARVDDFVQTLPNGYETHLGENASLVSGGQAQRIQIARALARSDGDVLILDECTSALDGANQGAVFESLLGEDMKEQGKTVVVVTHKMDVMKMCDRIVLLQDGCVVEQGRFDELVENRGVFATLARGGEWMG